MHYLVFAPIPQARKEAEAAGRRQRERQRRRRRAELIESAGKPARHPQAFQVRQNARNAIARENALLLEPTESRFRFRDVGPNPPKWAPPSHVPAMKPADLSSCSNEYRAYVERQMRIRQEREEREAKEEARQANQPRGEGGRRPPWTRSAGPPRAFTPTAALLVRAPTSHGAQSSESNPPFLAVPRRSLPCAERMVEERARVLHRSLPAPLGRSPTPNGREGTYAPPQRAISAQWRAGAVSDRDISPHRTFLDGPAQPSASTVLPPRLSFLEQRAERFGFDPTGALARRRQAVEALDAGGMEVSGLGSTASGVGEDASQAL